ncbi:MAG TPA: GNAT family N-acetyltransferase [Methanomassiliicoccales archaeon]|nr:GNAT family N-acetyltransferase [Methanomassiliicoccales archaeon]
MTEIRLVPMTRKDFEIVREAGVKRYAEENVRAGYWTSNESLKRSREAHDRLLPEGHKTEGHHFFKAMDAERDVQVGNIWIKVEPGEDRRGFIFDVFIDEEQRGKGYGRAMMEALESKARRMKLSSLALHVFAFNEAARHLYGSLGYEMKSLNMVKML